MENLFQNKMVFDKLYHILKNKGKLDNVNKVSLICLSGNMGAGKSTLSRELGDYLEKRDMKAVYWNQDWNQASRSEREVIRTKKIAENPNLSRLDLSKEIYFHSYHWDDCIYQIELMRKREDIQKVKLYQKTTGNRDLEMSLSFDKESNYVVLYDGGFAMHQPVRGFMDAMIVVEADEETRFQRMAKRALGLEKPFVLKKERFLELDEFTSWYLNSNRNQEDILIDNNDFNNRKIII